MDLQLGGKIAFVSGSTAGIGLAIASRLTRESAEVVINGRTEERVREAIAQIKKDSRDANVRGIAVDLGSAKGCSEVVRQLPRVDILVNNVGIFEPKPFEKIADEDWEKFFAVNVMSGVRLSRAYLPAMKERNWGRIVFVSSESALQIPAEMIHYDTTKTAQLAIARGLAETCQSTNVTVNSVLPGPTASEGVTEFVSTLAAENKISTKEFEKEFFKNARPTSILQRFIEPMRSPMSSASFAVRSLPRSTARRCERTAASCDRLASGARHSRRAHRWKTRIFDRAFQVLAVDRHPIKRGRFLAGRLTQKQNIVVVDPATVPAEECFPRDARRFLRRDFESPQCWWRSIPISAVMFLAHVDGKKQTFTVGRDRDAPVTAYAAVWNDFLDVPLCEEDGAVETDLIDIGLAKNRALVARPARRIKRGLILGFLS